MRWSALRTKTKATVVVTVAAAVWLGGVGSAAALVGSAVSTTADRPAALVATSDPSSSGPTASAEPTASARSETPTPTPTPTPVVVVTEVTEDSVIHFDRTTVQDLSLPKGQTRVTTAGVDGVLTKTFRITTTDGVETGRTPIGEQVTRPAVTEVTAVGTYVAPAPAPAPEQQPSSQSEPGQSPLVRPGAFCADAQSGVIAQAANGNSYQCGGKGPDANGHLHWNSM